MAAPGAATPRRRKPRASAALDVGTEHLVHEALVDDPHRPARLNAGAVRDAGQRAVLAELLDHAGNRIDGREIERELAMALPGEGLAGLGQAAFIAAGDDDRGAEPGQQPRRGPPDAGRCARDEDALAEEGARIGDAGGFARAVGHGASVLQVRLNERHEIGDRRRGGELLALDGGAEMLVDQRDEADHGQAVPFRDIGQQHVFPQILVRALQCGGQFLDELLLFHSFDLFSSKSGQVSVIGRSGR
jgi:hypothetical protein